MGLKPPHRLVDLKVWDLTSNSTRWDYSSAAPSDQILRIQFATLAGILAVVALSCFLLMVSILRLKKVRDNSFNLYLLSITFPDLISSGACFLTCAMSSAAHTYYSEAMCGWQSFYLVWGFTSNCWMNGVIAHQLFTMLKISHGRGRYNPPTRKRVIQQAICVYLYATVIALLGTWHIPFLPFKTGTFSGFACFPKDYDTASLIFWWLVFLPAFLLIPLGYVLYCAFIIIRRNYLPPVGRRRNLAVYFFRLVFVFVFMWVPFIVVVFLYVPIASQDVSTASTAVWVSWVGAAISHTQGLVSVLISMTKPDVRNAMLGTLTCGRWDKKMERERAKAARKKEEERQARLGDIPTEGVGGATDATDLRSSSRRVSFKGVKNGFSSGASSGHGAGAPDTAADASSSRSRRSLLGPTVRSSLFWWGSSAGQSFRWRSSSFGSLVGRNESDPQRSLNYLRGEQSINSSRELSKMSSHVLQEKSHNDPEGGKEDLNQDDTHDNGSTCRNIEEKSVGAEADTEAEATAQISSLEAGTASQTQPGVAESDRFDQESSPLVSTEVEDKNAPE